MQTWNASVFSPGDFVETCNVADARSVASAEVLALARARITWFPLLLVTFKSPCRCDEGACDRHLMAMTTMNKKVANTPRIQVLLNLLSLRLRFDKTLLSGKRGESEKIEILETIVYELQQLDQR